METDVQTQSPLASRLQNVSVSLTLRIVERAKELQSRGVGVIDLSVGQPDHPTPDNIKAAGIEAIESNFTRYTAASGIPELRGAIRTKLRRDNNLDYGINQIVVSCGAKHAIANAVLALVNPGDEVIIPEPCWLSYPELVYIAGGTPVFVPTNIEMGFHLQPEDLSRALTDRTKLIFLNSPCNPTGAMLTGDEMKRICDVVRDHPARIISDEIYEHLRFDGREHVSPASFPGMQEKTILINGVSKCYAMTGWRIGYSASTREITEGILKIQSQMTSSACSISQKAAAVGLIGDQGTVASMREDFSRRRKMCYKILSACKDVKVREPEGAFYIFPDVSAFFGRRAGDQVMTDAKDIAEHLMTECHVAVVPGGAFRAPECIRISYANSDENVEQGVTRICEALSDLK